MRIPKSIFQKTFFWNFVFFDSGETRIVKKTDSKKLEKKVQLLTFIFIKFNRLMNFLNFFGFSWKSKNFLIFGWYSERNYSFHIRRKSDNFLEKKPTYQKTYILSKIFLLFRNQNVLTSVWKDVRIAAGSGIWAHRLWLPTAVTPDTCIIQDTNDSANLNSALSWAVSGKGRKLRLLNWIFSFWIFFQQKIINFTHS